MSNRSTPFVALVLFAVAGACAAPRTPPATAPTPRPAAPVSPATTAPASTARPIRLTEAPRNWQLLDETDDGVPGISAEKAYRELLAGRKPARTVVVAVIDGGVDTAHVDLRANLWSNPRELPNGKDDDGDGHIDDTRGWNFIGGRDGRDVRYDTFEVTRLYVRCTRAPNGTAPLETVDGFDCLQIRRDYEKARAETEQTLRAVSEYEALFAQITPVLLRETHADSLSVASVSAINSKVPEVVRARAAYLQVAAQGITPKDIADAKEAFTSRAQYGVNTSYNPRPIVGDDTLDLAQTNYGNADVTGPDAKHGTHVAGIIAAVRGNGVGIDGIATNTKIMAIRAVPDGDERDKDIGNAIRFAVDHGANIISMSFGKSYSPQKKAVDDAVKYADLRGVLMVHAAGNDGENADDKPSYPTPNYQGGGVAQNWIEVGASSWRGGDSLVANFSNYGAKHVDVFAPGVDIFSTIPGNGYEKDSGTSMAAPVVSGVAALLMAYFPNLSAADVKRIILQSAVHHPVSVLAPGEHGGRISFSQLSSSGGIVNAYTAVKMAGEMGTTHP